jgi:aminoglycoside phosphotransferase (APT) family kinase protein
MASTSRSERPVLDQPSPVRPGEELPLEPLAAFLAALGIEGSLSVEQFPSGYSNLTYLLRVGVREMVLRRPPRGASVRTAHDMSREHRILSRLCGTWAKVPRPIALCEDPSLIGAPFYLMERVRGRILRGAQGALDAGDLRQLSESAIDTIAELHVLDYAAAGLGDLGKAEGYVARQVRGWTERYTAARTDALPEVERVAAWLIDHMPDDSPLPALVHNDYKYDNLVLDIEHPTRIVAVLDWEMATIGDPLMDVGTSLGYWLEPDDPDELRAAGFATLTAAPGNLSRAEVLARYAALSGREVGSGVFYFAFGLFKIAVIAQQIYARYKRGLTADPRFAGLLRAVEACARTAALAIERQRIDRLRS